MTTLGFAIWGLLARESLSGYDLTQRMEGRVGLFWGAGHSQIYTELARLVADGLIREAERGPRRRKRYEITEAGRAALRGWLTSPDPDRGSRNEALLRAFFLGHVEPQEAEEYLRGEAEFHREQVAFYEGVRPGGPGEEAPAGWTGDLVLEVGIAYERVLAEWAEWAAGQFRTRGSPGRRRPR